ncbi:hypothetical protein JYT44_03295 [Caldithrix abyssi]|nr:hypothetical protein [Caldithrix abyssi]
MKRKPDATILAICKSGLTAVGTLLGCFYSCYVKNEHRYKPYGVAIVFNISIDLDLGTNSYYEVAKAYGHLSLRNDNAVR